MSFTSQAFLNLSSLSHACARTCPARSSRSRIHRCQPLCASGSCRQATTPASTSFSALRTSSFALRKPAGSPAPARATTVTAPGAPRARLEIKRNSVGPGASARRLYAGARARHNGDGSWRAKRAARNKKTQCWDLYAGCACTRAARARGPMQPGRQLAALSRPLTSPARTR